MKTWKWFGSAGHLCVSNDCRFHLATEIGKYLISTVGEWFPRHKEANKPEEIGCGRTYETMVFKINGRCECGCGIPTVAPSELDVAGYNTPKAANKGHLKMCLKWSLKR